MRGLKNHIGVTRVENIEMTRGDTMSFGAKVSFYDEPQELESAFFTIKDNDEVLVQKVLGNGIWLDKQEEEEDEKGNPLSCMYYVVRVAPRDTENLPLGDYIYDFEINLNTDRFTLLHGRLRLTDEATRG